MKEKERFDQAGLPRKYRPLSAWEYWGLGILFAIPLIGFIFLIVFSFSDKNINRRSFARSYFCSLVLVIIILAVLAATGVLALLASSAGLSSLLNL